MEIEYETIKNGYVTKEQAIAIAACDRNLKDSIFKEFKKEKIYLGFISFSKFEVALIEINENFAWHVKVVSGDWGGREIKRIPILGIRYGCICWDGDFEEGDISCLVMCGSGEYYYYKDVDMSLIKKPDMEKYKEYINSESIYF